MSLRRLQPYNAVECRYVQCGLSDKSVTNLVISDKKQMNVSRIANTTFNNSTGNGCSCVEFVNGTLTINGSAVTDGHTTVEVYDIGISEYYAVYTMNYCEGNYLPHYYDKGAKAVLTSCKTPSVSRRFDLVSIIEDALENVGASLNQTLSLDDLDWPDGITNAFGYVSSASTAMIAFFLIGILFLLLATLAGTIALFRPSKNITVILLMTSVVSAMVEPAITIKVLTRSR